MGVPKKIWTIGLLACLVLFGGAGWFGFRFYRAYEHRKLLTNAHAALAKFPDSDALLWANKALEEKPDGIEENRLMAELAVVADSPEQMRWRARVAFLEPGSVRNYTDWASSAIHLHQPFVALDILHRAPGIAAQDASWQSVAAAAAASCGEYDEAEAHFEKASLLDPANRLSQVNLQIFRMGPPYTEKSPGARNWLQERMTDPAVGTYIKRALLQDALHRNDLTAAKPVQVALESDPNVNFSDRLACLEFMYRTGACEETLRRLKDLAKINAALAPPLATWMGTHHLGREAVAWIEETFPSLSRSVALQISEADILSTFTDWQSLTQKLAPANWGPFDFIRLAMLARAKREQGDAHWESAWRDIVKANAENDVIMLMLARLTQSWAWNEQAEDLYWRLSDIAPAQQGEATQHLFEIYESERNTGGLLRVSKKQLELAPNNIGRRNNYAFLALLLNVDRDNAARIAEENLKKAPDAAAIVTTYALSLLLKGRSVDARKVLERLGQEKLLNPDVAIYYACALAANNNEQEALKYEQIGLASKTLLPEEERLLKEFLGG